MISESESDPPKLPLFSLTPHLVDEPSGTLTPPLETSASVPFRWEEQPGKPRPCTDIILAPTRPEKRSLDLPPRLAIIDSNIMTKIPSPTTVLDGPSGKSVFSSGSFRFTTTTTSKEGRRRNGSFDSNCSGGCSPNDDVVLLNGGSKSKRFIFGSFRLNGGGGGGAHNKLPKVKDEDDDDDDDDEGSFVISPLSSLLSSSYIVDNNDTAYSKDKKWKKMRMRRNSSLSKVTRSSFWAAIYEGFKQVVPWKKKPKKESFTL